MKTLSSRKVNRTVYRRKQVNGKIIYTKEIEISKEEFCTNEKIYKIKIKESKAFK